MRLLPLYAAGAFLALALPIGAASAAPPAAPGFVQADWNGRPGWTDHWHHHWRHEWRDHWHPDWHHHWHHHWDRPYGYQY